jgi:hypothetical protein
MVERGPLVDGKTGRFEATVDGLSFEHYAEVLKQLGVILSQAGSERPCQLTVSR